VGRYESSAGNEGVSGTGAGRQANVLALGDSAGSGKRPNPAAQEQLARDAAARGEVEPVGQATQASALAAKLPTAHAEQVVEPASGVT
jgi:hypothetical protein